MIGEIFYIISCVLIAFGLMFFSVLIGKLADKRRLRKIQKEIGQWFVVTQKSKLLNKYEVGKLYKNLNLMSDILPSEYREATEEEIINYNNKNYVE
jgi:hypothetical protein